MAIKKLLFAAATAVVSFNALALQEVVPAEGQKAFVKISAKETTRIYIDGGKIRPSLGLLPGQVVKGPTQLRVLAQAIAAIDGKRVIVGGNRVVTERLLRVDALGQLHEGAVNAAFGGGFPGRAARRGGGGRRRCHSRGGACTGWGKLGAIVRSPGSRGCERQAGRDDQPNKNGCCPATEKSFCDQQVSVKPRHYLGKAAGCMLLLHSRYFSATLQALR